MHNQELLDFACDEIAEIIDEQMGLVDPEEVITKVVKQLGDENETIDAGSFRAEMLKRFEELYLCDPSTYTENSRWAHETDVEPIDYPDSGDLDEIY